MDQLVQYLFNTQLFMPHGTCLLWRPDLIAMHALGDTLIALAYLSIPVALVVFAKRRTDLEYKWVFGLFATFILACGSTHLLGVITLWKPVYGLEGVVKLATAFVSVVTAVLLWPIIPRALALPGPAQLRVANTQLNREIAERRAAQEELKRAYELVELRVEERTKELAAANESLSREIAERKSAEQQQALLVAELAHRVRNTLAIVRSLSSQTLRNSSSLEEFQESFEGRLQALAHAHGLLIGTSWRPSDLKTLIEHHLRVYVTKGGEFHAAGPQVSVNPKASLTLGLVLHELAANATKYGALSTPSGRVDITWEHEHSDGRDAVRLLWKEAGGPPVTPPAKSGFGSRLIQFSITHEFNGTADVIFPPDGLQCELVLPLTEGTLKV